MASENKSNKQTPHPVTIDGLQVHAMIGQGGQAKVYLCTKTGSNELLSVKVYDEIQKSAYRTEIEILLKLSHENIIKLQSYKHNAIVKYSEFFHQIKSIIVTQFAYYGDLYSLTAAKGGISEKVGKYLFLQILKTLQYFYMAEISHRDIKLQNILIDKNFNIKLIDFGLSTNFNIQQGGQVTGQNVGTQYYKAPEVYNSEYSCQKIDIFAVGVTMFCMLLNKIPFLSTKYSNKEYQFIRLGNYKEFWKFHIQKSKKRKIKLFQDQQFKSLMNKLFNHDPSLRPSFNQLYENQWLNSNVASKQQCKQQIEEAFKKLLNSDQSINENYKLIDNLICNFNKNKQQQGQKDLTINQETVVEQNQTQIL